MDKEIAENFVASKYPYFNLKLLVQNRYYGGVYTFIDNVNEVKVIVTVVDETVNNYEYEEL